MKYLIDSIKALLICAVVNAVYTFFTASSALMRQAENSGNDMGRLESFIYFSKVIEDFWPHIINGWFHSFGLSFVCCLILLALIHLKTHNEAFNSTLKDGAN